MEENFRTDLADERLAEAKVRKKVIDGIEQNIIKYSKKIKIIETNVLNENGSRLISKPTGNYTTIAFENKDVTSKMNFSKLKKAFCEVLQKYLDFEGPILVVGLGNKNMSADYLGPKVIDDIDVHEAIENSFFNNETQSAKAENIFSSKTFDENKNEIEKNEYEEKNKSEQKKSKDENKKEDLKILKTNKNYYTEKPKRIVYAISPGVIGTTGMETSDIINGIISKVDVSGMIIIDSLKSQKVSRLFRTIQITDTGITPGAGVGNRRKEISFSTTGKKVIAIGVPTVVDTQTIILDILEILSNRIKEFGFMNDLNFEEKSKILRSALEDSDGNLIVMPKEIDCLVDNIKEVISYGINNAV